MSCLAVKIRFIKEQEAKSSLRSLGPKTPLNKTKLLGDIFFSSVSYEMNEIVNNFLLAEDKFMPEIHIKHFGFTYSAYGLFTENKERIERFLQTGSTNYIYENDLDKA